MLSLRYATEAWRRPVTAKCADPPRICNRIALMKRVLAVLVTVAGAALVPSSVGAVHRTGSSACAASTVHYRTVTQAPRGVPGLPWVASSNSAFRGYLFYWGGTRWAHTRAKTAQIFTTNAHIKVSPKILWVALQHSGAALNIQGIRLDGAGSFSVHYPAASGGGQFPSYVSVPAAGCWRVAIRSGSSHGVVTFRATDRA